MKNKGKVILEARALCKSYGDKQTVLEEIDLQIYQGEFVVVMGPSGSGKSTLLYQISGMDQATSGQVLFEGEDLCKLSEKALASIRLQKMGFVFQQSHLLKNLKILDNILLPAYQTGRLSRAEMNKKALELLKITGISELATRDITEASGGQLQRVGICRALINSPEIVFGDEPTGALNSKMTAEVMDLLGQIHKAGTTMLVVTHDAKVALRSERVLFMRDGKIISELKQGTYEKGVAFQKEREKKLAEWLEQLEL